MDSEEKYPFLLTTRMLYFFSGISASALVPYLALWLSHDGLSSPQIGLVFALSTTVGIMAQPVWGILVDHFPSSHYPLLLVMAVPGIVAMGFNTPGLLNLIGIAMLFNVFMVSRSSLSDAYTISIISKAKVHYGAIRLFGSLGSAAGAFLAGLYISHVNIRNLWIPFMVFSILAAIWVVRLPQTRTVRSTGSFWQTLQGALANRRFLFFLLAGFLVQETLSAYDGFFSLAFHDIGGAFPDTGWALALGSLSNVPAMLWAGRLLRNHSPNKIMLLSAGTYVLRWTLMAAFPIPWVYVVIQLLHGLSFGLFWISSVTYVAQHFPAPLRATGQSLYSMVSIGMATISGNLICGMALERGGPVLLYSVAAASSAAGLLVLLLLNRNPAFLQDDMLDERV
ncbi:MAG: MFS transporter [Sulfobacillus benefaciens]|uniref:MFS transporter n=1 Tax=Sulfobacillus benefaciens TaxID=453960 RepID=A0A2T2X9Y6_9FIRM|nr:MAG: MFS transporter [Sulfobacillus benefaciens]